MFQIVQSYTCSRSYKDEERTLVGVTSRSTLGRQLVYEWNLFEPARIDLEQPSRNSISKWEGCFYVNPKVRKYLEHLEICRKIRAGSE